MASISWTTRPSSWTSPRVSMAAHPNVAFGPMLARSANGTAASRARSADRTGTAVGVDRRLDGRGAGRGVDIASSCRASSGRSRLEPHPDPEPVDVRRRAGLCTILVVEPDKRIVDGGVQGWRVAKRICRHRSASSRAYDLSRPRPGRVDPRAGQTRRTKDLRELGRPTRGDHRTSGSAGTGGRPSASPRPGSPRGRRRAKSRGPRRARVASVRRPAGDLRGDRQEQLVDEPCP